MKGLAVRCLVPSRGVAALVPSTPAASGAGCLVPGALSTSEAKAPAAKPRKHLSTILCALCGLNLIAASISSTSADGKPFFFDNFPALLPVDSNTELTAGSDDSPWYGGIAVNPLYLRYAPGAWHVKTNRSTYSALANGSASATIRATPVTTPEPTFDVPTWQWKQSGAGLFVQVSPSDGGSSYAFTLPVQTKATKWWAPDGFKTNAMELAMSGVARTNFRLGTNLYQVVLNYEAEWERPYEVVTNTALTNAIWRSRLSPELVASFYNAFQGAMDRQYFAWEGQSNVWDEAVYGPTNRREFCFADYSGFATNAPPEGSESPDGAVTNWLRNATAPAAFFEYQGYDARFASNAVPRRVTEMFYTNYLELCRSHLAGFRGSSAGGPSNLVNRPPALPFCTPFALDRPYWEPTRGGDNLSRWSTTAAFPLDPPEEEWPEFGWRDGESSGGLLEWKCWSNMLYKLDRMKPDFVYWDEPHNWDAVDFGASAWRILNAVTFGEWWARGLYQSWDSYDRALESSWQDVMTNEFKTACPPDVENVSRRFFLDPLAAVSQSISLLDRTYDEYTLRSVTGTWHQVLNEQSAYYEAEFPVTLSWSGGGLDFAASVEVGEGTNWVEVPLVEVSAARLWQTNYPVAEESFPYVLRVERTDRREDRQSSAMPPDEGVDWWTQEDLHGAGEAMTDETVMDGAPAPTVIPDWDAVVWDGGVDIVAGGGGVWLVYVSAAVEIFATHREYEEFTNLVEEVAVSNVEVVVTNDVEIVTNVVDVVYTNYVEDVFVSNTVSYATNWWYHYQGAAEGYCMSSVVFRAWHDIKRWYDWGESEPSAKRFPYRPGWSFEEGEFVGGEWWMLYLAGLCAQTNFCQTWTGEFGETENDLHLYKAGKPQPGGNDEFWNKIDDLLGSMATAAHSHMGGLLGGDPADPLSYIPIEPFYGDKVVFPKRLEIELDLTKCEIARGIDCPTNAVLDLSADYWGLPRDAWKWGPETAASTGRVEYVAVGLPAPKYEPRIRFASPSFDDPEDNGMVEHPPLSVNGKADVINKVDWRFKHLRRGTE